VSGTLAVPGLSQPVRVARDRWGVPHITAQSEHDLFFAQGFVQAQDRLFQMDLWRRSVQGRLAEVLGPNFVDRDAMTRRMQYHGDLAVEWASYGPGMKPIAEAFVSGINAWVTIAGHNLPDEFILAGWRPELWSPADLLNRTDAFLASGNAALQAFRLQLIAAVGEKQASALLPAVASYRPPHDVDLDRAGGVMSDALRRVGTTPFFSGFAAPFGGSNAWAVAGARTSSGAPLLASDPHQPLANPSLRYLVHLQAPGWNVIGAASPWRPGVVIGHNDRVAWGMAAYPADTQDIYVEQASTSITRIKDPIVVKGEAKPFAFEREYTPHGAVIASDREHHLVFTLSWSGFEPGGAGELGALAIDRAATSSDLRAALTRWKMPVVDVVYADGDGHVGHQVAGAAARLPAATSSGSAIAIAANENVARTNRIGELLAGAAKYTVDDVKRQQHDVTAWNAGQLVPRLGALHTSEAPVDDARLQLLNWDRRITADSSVAALYVFWEQALRRKVAEARVPAALLDDYLAHADFNVAEATRAGGAVLLDALGAAVARVKTQTAAGNRAPAWGALHRVLFKHPLAVTQAARRLYDVGPFGQSGYADTVMSSFARSNVDIGASFRQIADLGDWDRSVATNAPGQSELPRSSHFSDLAKLWAAGEYFPLAYSDGAVQANTETTLVLTPSP
jgi:penicillin amidase